MGDGLIDVPGIEGGIGSDRGGKLAQHRLQEEGQVVADSAGIEGLGKLGQHRECGNIAMTSSFAVEVDVHDVILLFQ